MIQPKSFISKSVFLCGVQCPKLLWHAVNTKDLLPQPDTAQQAIFDQGHEVGSLAKQLFLEGVEVGGADMDQATRTTSEALKLRRPLFEAAFQANGGLCRVDVLSPTASDKWELIEIKSSTAVKAIHIQDVAFQAWVVSKAGVPVTRAKLMCIDPRYVRSGEIEPKKLFTSSDLTVAVSTQTGNIGNKVSEMLAVIRQPRPPEVQIGPHCNNPYTCPLYDHCWKFLPEQNVTTLYRGKKKGFQLLARGITYLREIPGDVTLTDKQAIQKRCAESGMLQVDRDALATFLKRLRYPLHFLDFETFSTAIPLFDRVCPYQQVPFQFSLHIIRASGEEPEHWRFLADGREDPRPEFMRQLRECLQHEGSIVAYNASFEKSRLRECAEFLPQHADWVQRVERRFIDLLKPFRSFHYFHSNQCGSASIKSVLPALTGKGYEHLEIQDGSTASLEFLRVNFSDVTEDERQRVRRQLEKYCALDTAGMIWIVKGLEKLTRG